MNKSITGYVGLDVHATSTAISFAAAGRAKPRFVGTVGAKRPQLTKALAQLGKPRSLVVVYEAGPCGYKLARELADQGYQPAKPVIRVSIAALVENVILLLIPSRPHARGVRVELST